MSGVTIVGVIRAIFLAASLRWDAPPECPDAAAVTRQVFAGNDESPIELQVVVTRDPGGYRLHGELRFEGHRQPVALSHGHGCDALVKKLVFHVASLLDEPAPPAERARSGSLRLATGLDAGSLRTCSAGSCAQIAVLAGGSIAGGWRRGRLRVELGVPLVTGQTRAPEAGTFGELTIRWYGTGVQLRLCGALAPRNVELLACGELAMQLLVGDPEAGGSDFRRAVPVLAWTSARLVLGAVWWIRPQVGLRLEAAPGVNLRLVGRAFDAIDGQVARRPLVEIGLMHLAVGLGVDLRFGARRPGGAHP